MRQFKAFVLVLVLSILISVLITTLALFFASKANPQSGSFNLFGENEFLAAVLAGGIYGGVIGVIIGLSSGIFLVAIQNLQTGNRSFLLISAFAFLIGIIECLLFYMTNKEQFWQNKAIVPIYLLVSGFLISSLPQLIAKKWVGF